jgi:hypothetical protein
MGCQRHKPGSPKRARGLIRTLRLAGFLTVILGFPTGAGLATPLDDALQRLDQLERQRSDLLAEADSLGELLRSLPPERNGEAKGINRQADRLGKRSSEIEVELLLAREECRNLAQRELDALGARATPAERDAARELALRDLLDRRLADLLGGDLVLVQPDSLDGYETLLDKQAYLQDLRDRVAALDLRLVKKMERARRERALREASKGFEDEAKFLDEAGRVGSDEIVRLRGDGDPGSGGEGMARIVRSGNTDPVSNDTDPPLPPGDGADVSTAPPTTLAQARARLARDLDLVSTALESTNEMLRRFGTRSP